jgi:hypothetical protein
MKCISASNPEFIGTVKVLAGMKCISASNPEFIGTVKILAG